jgi:hypothetical protein
MARFRLKINVVYRVNEGTAKGEIVGIGGTYGYEPPECFKPPFGWKKVGEVLVLKTGAGDYPLEGGWTSVYSILNVSIAILSECPPDEGSGGDDDNDDDYGGGASDGCGGGDPPPPPPCPSGMQCLDPVNYCPPGKVCIPSGEWSQIVRLAGQLKNKNCS